MTQAGQVEWAELRQYLMPTSSRARVEEVGRTVLGLRELAAEEKSRSADPRWEDLRELEWKRVSVCVRHARRADGLRDALLARIAEQLGFEDGEHEALEHFVRRELIINPLFRTAPYDFMAPVDVANPDGGCFGS